MRALIQQYMKFINTEATLELSHCCLHMLTNSLMHHGPHDSLSADVGLVEQRVEVRQEAVADLQVMSGAVHQERVSAV